MQQEIQGVHIAKFICAILVIMIHVAFPLKSILRPLMYLGVPIFFMISGYFLVDESGNLSMDKLRKVFLKILKITILANLFYFAFRFILIYLSTSSSTVAFLNDLIEFKSLAHWIFSGDKMGAHLWYLTAYLQVLLFVIIAYRLNIKKLIYILAVFGFLFNILCGSYSWILFSKPLILEVTRSSFGIGLPCVALGMWLRSNINRMPSSNIIFWVFIALSLVMYAECYYTLRIFKTMGDIQLTTIPIALCVLCLAIQMPINYPQWAIVCGRDLSLYIYIFHLAIRDVVDYLIPTGSKNGLLLIFTILLSIASAYIFAQLVKFRKIA